MPSLQKLPQCLAVSSTAEWAWFAFGMTGNVIFGSRFFIQWIYSEKHRESKVPEIFWWISICGTLVLFTYFLHKREWVALCGNGPQLVPYVRNLMLIYRKKREGRRGFSVEPPPVEAVHHSPGTPP